MKHENYVTHIKNEEDVQYLRTPLLPVNMRLFKTSKDYRNIVLNCCQYLEKMCLTKCDGYKKPHGISGANLAIPFNIIGVTVNRNEKNEKCKIMINPRIIRYYGNRIVSQSNCGSLTLDNPIDVERYEKILVSYFDPFGNYKEEEFNRNECSLSIQHEIDHNNGILIIDRQVKYAAG